ncbi:hypothetical protein JOC55_005584 [Paenibacillus sacheonensis]|nr:hypothetical protein [Paenibacillus sacheonensis]
MTFGDECQETIGLEPRLINDNTCGIRERTIFGSKGRQSPKQAWKTKLEETFSAFSML